MKCKVVLVTEHGFAWADVETDGPIPKMGPGNDAATRDCFERHFEPAIRVCMEHCANHHGPYSSLGESMMGLAAHLPQWRAIGEVK